tara:strand:+ start:74 stop:778 length:705 start_codon:yes stop_codon:yes gene_type:complete
MHVFVVALSSLVTQRAALSSLVTPQRGALTPSWADASRRAAAPRAALVTFASEKAIVSEPFEATEAGLKEWFGRSESVGALCSMADEFKELPNDRVEIISKIPFPGIIVKSVTVLAIAKDLETPKFEISTVSSETVCETGPRWVRDLLVRLLGATKSTSDNQVTVALDAAGRATVRSDVQLKVSINFPGLLPLPLGPLEREGSKSLQDVLDQQMAPVLAKFRTDYLAFEKGRQP